MPVLDRLKLFVPELAASNKRLEEELKVRTLVLTCHTAHTAVCLHGQASCAEYQHAFTAKHLLVCTGVQWSHSCTGVVIWDGPYLAEPPLTGTWLSCELEFGSLSVKEHLAGGLTTTRFLLRLLD